jgi:hypothetical protein
MILVGGIEKKTINLHRAICLVDYSDIEMDFNTSMPSLIESICKSLRPRYWRGIGVGLIFISEKCIRDEDLNNAVYSGDKMTSCIIQWIINLLPSKSTAQIAHTFTQVCTSFMINEILDYAGVQSHACKLIVPKQESLLKIKII